MRKERINRSLYYAAAFILLAVSGCASLEIKSLWRDQEIKIDGKNDDWKSGTYIKDVNCSFYACNDESNLYLCIVSSDRDLMRKMTMLGMTVWVESDKEKDNRFGIHFPIGMTPEEKAFQELPEVAKNGTMGQRMNGFNRPDEGDGSMDEEKMFSGVREYELLNKDEKIEGRYLITEDNGLQMKAGRFQGRFVYELKIPIVQKNASLTSIAADTTSNIKLEFVSGQLDMEKMRKGMRNGKMQSSERGQENDMPDDMPPMGEGGMGPGGGPRGRGAMPGAGSSQSNKQIKFTVNIQLSSKAK